MIAREHRRLRRVTHTAWTNEVASRNRLILSLPTHQDGSVIGSQHNIKECFSIKFKSALRSGEARISSSGATADFYFIFLFC